MAFSNPYSPVLTQVSLPFSNPIPGGLSTGKQIQIQGIVQNKPGANGFSINLCEGPQVSPSCGLHFNPRFTENCIVRNAMLGGSWGIEERQGGLPIIKEQIFEIIIMVTPASFQIAVNGRHFTEFYSRFPTEKLKYLTIDGSFLKINFVKYEGGNTGYADTVPGYGAPQGYAPPPYTPGGFVAAPMVPGPAVYQMTDPTQPKTGIPRDNTMHNPPVPLTQAVLGGKMQPNRMIYISGVPHPGASRFSVNLMSNQFECAFHFDVRFSYGNDRNIVVRNTQTNGNWGNEERAASHFPFSPNAPFDMMIMATPKNFKVAVNNSHFTEYHHRLPLQKSTTLNITGDVRITTLRFQ